MEEKKLFSTVPFGFEKRAVIDYIGQLNDAYENELKEKDEQIQQLRKQLSELCDGKLSRESV